MIASDHTLAFTVGNKSIRLSRRTAFLLLILLLGAIFRFWNLSRWSLWIDELNTLRVAQQLRILREGIPDDQHPPLYYILMHYLSQISDREVWLRLPAALAGWLALPLMWRVGRLFSNEQTGLTAVALLAFSPLHIWYSREARMYGVASLFWVASIFFYLRSLKRDSWLDSLALSVMTLTGIFLAYPTLGLWGLEISLFWLLWHLNGQKIDRLIRWLMAQALIALGFYLWWPFFQQQLERVSITFEWPILTRLGLDLSGTFADTIYLGLSVGIGLLMAGLFIWLLVWWRPNLLVWVTSWFQVAAIGIVILFILATILGAIPRGLSLRRQLLVFWPPMVLLAGWALVYIGRFWLTAVVLTLSFCLAVVSLLGPPHEDWRGAATWLMAQAEPTDMIIVAPNWIKSGFDYYYKGAVPYRSASNSEFAGEGAGPFSSGQRVWVVLLDNPGPENDISPISTWFERHATYFATHSFSRNIRVTGYEVK